MAVCRFTLLKSSKLLEYQQALVASIKNWADKWGYQGESFVSCQNAYEAYQQLTAIDNAELSKLAPVLLHTDQGLSEYIASQVFGQNVALSRDADGRDLLAHTLGQEMLHELCVSLLSAIHFDAPATRSQASLSGRAIMKRGLGGLYVQITLGKFKIELAGFPELPNVPVKANTGGLTPIASACRNKTMRLELRLNHAEIAIQDFLQLHCGDVLKLNHSLSEPLSLQTAEHDLVCLAYLGKSHGDTAIELLGPKKH